MYITRHELQEIIDICDKFILFPQKPTSSPMTASEAITKVLNEQIPREIPWREELDDYLCTLRVEKLLDLVACTAFGKEYYKNPTPENAYQYHQIAMNVRKDFSRQPAAEIFLFLQNNINRMSQYLNYAMNHFL